MPITAVRSSETMSDGTSSTPDLTGDLPPWMVARRERQVGATNTSPVPADALIAPMEPANPPAVSAPASPTPATTESANVVLNDFVPFPDFAKPQPVPAPEVATEEPPSFVFRPTLPRKKAKPVAPVVTVTKHEEGKTPPGNWFTRWFSNQSLIGFGVSLCIHTAALVLLAFVIISNVSKQEDVSLWGVVDSGDEIGGNIVFDTTMPIDPGESASEPATTLQVDDALRNVGIGAEDVQAATQGKSSKGKGDGDSGDGSGVGAPSVAIPGYAQTKGSFSAWPEPRDPQPMQNYHIVIQVRLPRAAKGKKYRASDLTGMVIGTDKYKQEIRYKHGESFDVLDGVVEIRVLVPGGGMRVRDTVSIESKLLREKQTFEIEF